MRYHLYPLFFSFSLILSQLLIAQQRPNIVIIISDDHAYQTISAYGSQLTQTPGIDRIAREGVRFDKAYVTNSICGPSRAVIITGKYSHINGFKDNDNSIFNGTQPTFIKQLTGNGYETAWIGKWHLGTKPQGFTYWKILPGQGHYYNPDFLLMDSSIVRSEGYVSNLTQDFAEEWLEKRDKSKPFCLIVGHKATHRTWLPDTVDMGRFRNTKFPLPHNFYDEYAGREAAAGQDMTISKTMIPGYDLKMYLNDSVRDREGSIRRMNPAQKQKFKEWYGSLTDKFYATQPGTRERTEMKYQLYMQDYLSTAASLDRNIERMLNYLDKNQLTQNTLVIYLSDQGFYMGEHGWFDKRFMYEESFRTPMVMRFPGIIKPGTVNSEMVMNLDLAPTVLEVAGVNIPGDMQGQSILPLVKSESAKGRKAMYYHYYENGTHSVSPHFGISTERYKLIRFYERADSWELFDLKTDEHEMQNLYGQQKYKKITKKLKKQLRGLILKYQDTAALKWVDKK